MLTYSTNTNAIDGIVKEIQNREGKLGHNNSTLNSIVYYKFYTFEDIKFAAAYIDGLQSPYAVKLLAGDIYMVLLPESFVKLSFKAARFVLLHEIGHISDFIHDKIVKDPKILMGLLVARPIATAVGIVYPSEVRADLYALNHTDDNADDALEYLNEAFKLIFRGEKSIIISLARIEIKLRVKKLKKHEKK